MQMKNKLQSGKTAKNPRIRPGTKVTEQKQKTAGKVRPGKSKANTPTVPILRDTPKKQMGVIPFPGEGITLEPVSMNL